MLSVLIFRALPQSNALQGSSGDRKKEGSRKKEKRKTALDEIMEVGIHLNTLANLCSDQYQICRSLLVRCCCGLHKSSPSNPVICQLVATTIDRPVCFLMLSIHTVGGRPLPRWPSIIPCKMSFLKVPCFLHLCPKYHN